MIYIEIIQNSGGRTGHKMKDYLTAFCFYFLFGYKIIKNKYWRFPKNNCNNHLDMFNLYNNELFVNMPRDPVKIKIEFSLCNWLGMKYKKFQKIINEIQCLQENNKNRTIIVQLSKATRIQLCDIYNWELNNFIEKGSYDKIKSYLRTQFLSSPLNNQVKLTYNQNILNIVIHIRKGDVFERPLHKSVKYYENIIKLLKQIQLNKNIIILTEKWEGYNGEDVYELKKFEDENTDIEIIFEMCLYEYFADIINSDIFVPTIGQGSFSDLVIHYKSKDTIIIYNKELRQNNFNDNMNNSLIETNKQGHFNIQQLKNFIKK